MKQSFLLSSLLLTVLCLPASHVLADSSRLESAGVDTEQLAEMFPFASNVVDSFLRSTCGPSELRYYKQLDPKVDWDLIVEAVDVGRDLVTASRQAGMSKQALEDHLLEMAKVGELMQIANSPSAELEISRVEDLLDLEKDVWRRTSGGLTNKNGEFVFTNASAAGWIKVPKLSDAFRRKIKDIAVVEGHDGSPELRIEFDLARGATYFMDIDFRYNAKGEFQDWAERIEDLRLSLREINSQIDARTALKKIEVDNMELWNKELQHALAVEEERVTRLHAEYVNKLDVIELSASRLKESKAIQMALEVRNRCVDEEAAPEAPELRVH